MKIPKWLLVVLMYAAWLVTMLGALLVAMIGRETLNLVINVFFPVDPKSLNVVVQIGQRRTLDRTYVVMAGLLLLAAYVYFESYLRRGLERRNLRRNFVRLLAIEVLVWGGFWLPQVLVSLLARNFPMALVYLLPVPLGIGMLFFVKRYLKKNPPVLSYDEPTV